MLASYGHVLDPVTSARNGIIFTFADTVTLYEQVGWLGPVIGILTVAGALSAVIVFLLGWRQLWPVPVFLFWSCLIFLFNPAGLGSFAEVSIHLIYGALSFVCAYLFLRHGHLLSPGFLGYVALLCVDVLLHVSILPGGLLGLVFENYVPSIVTAFQFLAVAVLLRMIWLMVRDNHALYRSMDRSVRRRSAARAFMLWWPAAVIFVGFGVFWLVVINFYVQPAIIKQIDQGRDALEAQMGPLLNPELDIDRTILSHGDLSTAQLRDLKAYFALLETAQRRMQASDWVAAQLQDHRQKSHAFYQEWQAETHAGEDPLERSVRRWTQLQIGVSDIRIQLGIIEAGYEAQSTGDFPTAAEKKLADAFPRSALPTLKVPKCWFWEVGCQVEATIARRVNSLMTNLHDDLFASVKNQLSEIDRLAGREATRATQSAREWSEELHSDVSRQTTKAIRDSFRIWRNISLLASLYSAIVLLKTYLIVFSRVIFSPKTGLGAAAQFLPHPAPETPSAISRHGSLYRIPKTAKEAHFVSRWGVTLEGPPPARRRPMGFRFPVARILSGTWAMNRIDGNRDGEEDEFDADLKVDEPAELVAWTLAPGERVIFHFSDFIGMSEGVHVRRVSSLSITTLVLGRMIYHAAEGPGTLILRTTAAARLSTSGEGARPAPMPKLVAWGAETRFGVLAALTTVDTFLSGHNLKVNEADRVVWDTSTKRGNGPGTGIIRFVTSFLLPI